ncbi:MAG: twin-arginine translocation signal domain-containing protein, partial [Verrucomicrobiota bacterium]
MIQRRTFLKSCTLGAGAMTLAPSFNQLFASPGSGGIPKRFIFIRKSSGIRPAEIALRDFSDKDKALDEKKQPLEVDLDRHELPTWLRGLDAYTEHMTILQGLSSKMSENVHWSFLPITTVSLHPVINL